MLRYIRRNENAPEGLSVLESLLYTRGIRTQEERESFLHPCADQFCDPMRLSGIREALSVLNDAKQRELPVVVYGDYDVDGMCASAIMVSALTQYGLKAKPYVPLREAGYGLNLSAVETLSTSAKVLVTVDLGITNHDEVRRAQELGMRVIVTDHHQLSLSGSPADAVINPLLGGYPYPRLCGAGVAFKMAQALLGEAALSFLDLAALATVADIVPLTGENRVIVSLGLPLISARKRAGLAALLRVSGVVGDADSYTLGFQLGPRLNAAGRLEDASLGVKLLLTESQIEADALASRLDAANAERKRIESTLLEQALFQARAHDFTREPALIVWGEGWHAGVIGLVAGRLCQRFACPAAVLSEESGMLHGSLRSVPGINIHQCLQACDDLLLRYGGHEQAAGVTLQKENLPAFCERLQNAVRSRATDELLLPAQEYDMELEFSQADEALTQALSRMEPFGFGNPSPLFLCRNVRIERRRVCGTDGAHLQLTLRQNMRVLDGIAFGKGPEANELCDVSDVVMAVGINDFRGQKSVKCDAKAFRPAQGRRAAALQSAGRSAFENALLDDLLQAGKRPCRAESSKDSWTRATSGPVNDSPLEGVRGTLLIARTPEMALKALSRYEDKLELCKGVTTDPRCFHTLLLFPDTLRVSGFWRRVVLLDGEAFAGEAQLLAHQLAQARIDCPPSPSRSLCALMRGMDAGDAAYRELYRLLRKKVFSSLQALCEAAGLTEVQTRTGLWAFAQLGLISYAETPFAYAVLPAASCALDDSPMLSQLRRTAR